MIKYAIYFIDEGMFLETDKYVNAETNESPMVKNIENAMLFDDETTALNLMQYKRDDGYECKIIEVKISYQVL